MGLAERKCIPTKDVLGVLQTLSSTLIFNTATKEERLALASRLRRWAVEDGTYLIREGDGDTNQSAIFMIGGYSIGQRQENFGDVYRSRTSHKDLSCVRFSSMRRSNLCDLDITFERLDWYERYCCRAQRTAALQLSTQPHRE